MKPKIIGITGGIGSGKTTAAKCIETMGFPVYYSDDRAKTIVNDHAGLKQYIKTLLGEAAYDKNGFYDRKYVSGIVFSNQALLLQLNALIHPAVKTDFEDWVGRQKADFIFKETALLFELNLDEQCDKSILVTAGDNIRIKRVMERDHKTSAEVAAIIRKQMPEEEKIPRADFVIYNNAGIAELHQATREVLEQLTRHA